MKINMKIALVHDFLTQLGGAERVLDELIEMYPEADVYTLVYDKEKTFGRYTKINLKTSFIQRLPGGVKHYKWYVALMPLAIRSFDLSKYNLIISDASAFAKGVRITNRAKHICYCHTPTRYLWQMEKEYVSAMTYPWIVKLMVRPVLYFLRIWDYRAAQRVDLFIANSKEVQGRIKKYYGRESQIIYPPINTDFFRPANNPSRDYFLAVGRLEPYKKMDLVIRVFSDLGLALKVAGTGSQSLTLKSKILNPNIQFLGRVSDHELRALYQNAKAFIFPALEDAGMMILESLACGTPVIAYGAGGALEFIREGIDGEFFSEQSESSLKTALKNFDQSKYESSNLSNQALRYSRQVFRDKLKLVAENFEN